MNSKETKLRIIKAGHKAVEQLIKVAEEHIIKYGEDDELAADKLMTQYPGYDLIHGHTHRQNTHIMVGYTRYVLGDWDTCKGNAIKLGESLEWLEID